VTWVTKNKWTVQQTFGTEPNFDCCTFNWVINWCHRNGGWQKTFYSQFWACKTIPNEKSIKICSGRKLMPTGVIHERSW